MTMFLTIFRRFSKIVTRARRKFPNIFRTFSEDCRRFSRKTKDFRGRTGVVSIIQQHISDYVAINNGDLKTCENNILTCEITWYFHVRVKISCLRAKAHPVFHWRFSASGTAGFSSIYSMLLFTSSLCTIFLVTLACAGIFLGT